MSAGSEGMSAGSEGMSAGEGMDFEGEGRVREHIFIPAQLSSDNTSDQ